MVTVTSRHADSDVELVVHYGDFERQVFLAHYNQLEMKAPTGHWVVPVAKPEGGTA